MDLVRNYKERKAWAKEHDMSLRGRETPRPEHYPCFAYAIVQSFGYEEEQPVYLYQKDLQKMLVDLIQSLSAKKWQESID